MSRAADAQDPEWQPPDALQQPYQNAGAMVLRKCWDRINRHNEHFVAAIVGREGIGKSHTAIKLGTVLDDEFSHEQVLFSAADFLELLRDESYRRGAIYVLDEAGVSFGVRSWQDKGQILANQAMQLIRSHNIGLIFTLPRLDELDSQTQGRLQAFYEITGKTDGEHVTGRWKWVDPDRTGTTGKVYKKYPRTQWGDRIREIKFTPPPAHVVEPYEERKRDYQQQIYDEAIGELRDAADTPGAESGVPGPGSDLSVEEVLAQIDEPAEFVKPINDGMQHVIDRDRLEAEFDIGEKRSRKVANGLKPEVDEDVL